MASSGLYFQPNLGLSQIQELLRAPNRIEALGRIHSSQNGSEYQFYRALFTQLELEQSYDSKIHQVYKTFTEYLVNYKQVFAKSPHSHDVNALASILNVHQITNLKLILVELGATNDQVKFFETYQTQSQANITLLSHFLKYGSAPKPGQTTAPAPLPATQLLSTTALTGANALTDAQNLPYGQNLVIGVPDSPRVAITWLDELINITKLASEPSAYSPPNVPSAEEPGLVGYKITSDIHTGHLPLLIAENIESTLDQSLLNPFTTLYNLVNADVVPAKKGEGFEKPYGVSAVSLSESSFGFVFYLHDSKIINLKDTKYFPTLRAIYSVSDPTFTNYPGYTDVLGWFLAKSKAISDKIDSQEWSDRDPVNVELNGHGISFSTAMYNIFPKLSYQQLIQIQDQCGELKEHKDFLVKVLERFFPRSFLQTRVNNFTGAIDTTSATEPIADPYSVYNYTQPLPLLDPSAKEVEKNAPLEQRLASQGLCHPLDRNVYIVSTGDLVKYKDHIPSFLLTSMALYEQALSLIFAHVKFNSDGYSIRELYYSALAAFLMYCAQYNIYRFDLFDSKFMDGYVSCGITEESHKYSISYFSLPSELERIFPQTTFDAVMKKYIFVWFLRPEVKSWDLRKYTKWVYKSHLRQMFYEANLEFSPYLYTAICKKPEIPVADVEKEADKNAVRVTQQGADKVYQIANPNVTSNQNEVSISSEYDLIQYGGEKGYDERLAKILQLYESDNHYKYTHDNTTVLSWASNYDRSPHKSQSFVDVSGNVMFPLCVRNVDAIKVNVYEIDIFAWFQNKIDPNSVSIPSFDHNVDLEGYIPNYTCQVNLLGTDVNKTNGGIAASASPTVSQNHHTKGFQKYFTNLVLSNLPKTGTFIIEIVNGTNSLRTCVNRGKFSTVQKPIKTGTLVLVLDHFGKVVPDARIYIGNDMFTTNHQKGTKPATTSTPAVDSELTVENSFIHIPSYKTARTMLITNEARQHCTPLLLAAASSAAMSLNCNWFVSSESLTTSLPPSPSPASDICTLNATAVNLKTGSGAVIGGGHRGGEALIRPTLYYNGTVIDPTAGSGVTVLKSTLTLVGRLDNSSELTDIIHDFPLFPSIQSPESSGPLLTNKSTKDRASPKDGVNVPSQEAIHAFAIPHGLTSISFSLDVTIQFEGKEIDLSSSHTTTVANITTTTATTATGMFFLRQINGSYFIFSIDRSGLPIPFTPVHVQMEIGWLVNYSVTSTATRPAEVLYPRAYCTDKNGCFELGALFGVKSIKIGYAAGTLYHPDQQNTNVKVNGYLNFTLPTSTQITTWPTSLNVLIDDAQNGDDHQQVGDESTNGFTENRAPSQRQQPQVVLPLPYNFDTEFFYQHVFSTKSNSIPDLQKVLTTAGSNHSLTTKLTMGSRDYKKTEGAFYNYLLNNGTIQVTELGITASVSNRQITTSRIVSLANNQLFIGNLLPNRTYIVKITLPTQKQMTCFINTYRNPAKKIVTAPLWGSAQLPFVIQSDQTLNKIFNYLVLRNNSLIHIDENDSAKYLLSTTRSGYDYKHKSLQLEFSNIDPASTKLLIFGTNLATTQTELADHCSQVHTLSLDPALTQFKANPVSSSMEAQVVKIGGASISGEREYINYRRDLINSLTNNGNDMTGGQIGVMLPQPTLILNKRLVQHTDPIIEKAKAKAQIGRVEAAPIVSVADDSVLELMSMVQESKRDMRRDEGSKLKQKKIAAPAPKSLSRKKSSMKEKRSYNDDFYEREERSYGDISPSYGASAISRAPQSYGQVQFDNSFYPFDIMRTKSLLLANLNIVDLIENKKDDEVFSTQKVTIQFPFFEHYSSVAVYIYNINTSTYSITQIPIVTETPRLPFFDALNPPTEDQKTASTEQARDAEKNESPLTLQPFLQTSTFSTTIPQTDLNIPYYEQHCAHFIPDECSKSVVLSQANTTELEVITNNIDLYSIFTSVVKFTQTHPLFTSHMNWSTRDNTYTRTITALQKFKFLYCDWNTLPQSAKVSNYDRHSCHELNMYIFNNDRWFFENVIRPHLLQKTERDVVDLWLLSQATPVPAFWATNPDKTQVTPPTDEQYQLFNNVKVHSRSQMGYLYTKFSSNTSASGLKFNIFEITLILSVVDQHELYQLGYFMKYNQEKNISHSKDNSSMLSLFESCLRRKMLSLSSATEETKTEGNAGDDDSNVGAPEPLSDIDTSHDEIQFDQYGDEEGYGGESSDYDDDDSIKECEDAPGNYFSSETCAGPTLASYGLMAEDICDAPVMMSSRCESIPMEQKRSKNRSDMMEKGGRPAPHKPSTKLDDIGKKYEQNNKDTSHTPYEPLGVTGEYEEKYYYIDARLDGALGASGTGLQGIENNSKLVPYWTDFWCDYAQYLGSKAKFNIDNDWSSAEKKNDYFVTKSIFEWPETSANEVMLMLATIQLGDSSVVTKAHVMRNVSGQEIWKNSANYGVIRDGKEIDMKKIAEVTKAATHIQPINLEHIANEKFTFYTIIDPSSSSNGSRTPFIILTKQLQQLSNTKTAPTEVVEVKRVEPSEDADSSDDEEEKADGEKDYSNILTAQHYYIDVTSSIQKYKPVYVKPNRLCYDKPYVCQVVVSNKTSQHQTVQSYLEIPHRSLPIHVDFSTLDSLAGLSGGYTSNLVNMRSTTDELSVSPYSSKIIQYSFYIPRLTTATSIATTHYGTVLYKKNDAGIPVLYEHVQSIKIKCSLFSTKIGSTVVHDGRHSHEYIAKFYTNDQVIAFLEKHFAYTPSIKLTESGAEKAHDNLDDKIVSNGRTFDISLLFHRLLIDFSLSPTPANVINQFKFYLRVVDIVKGYATHGNVADDYSVKTNLNTLMQFSFFWLKQIYTLNFIPSLNRYAEPTPVTPSGSSSTITTSASSVASPEKKKGGFSAFTSKLFRRSSTTASDPVVSSNPLHFDSVLAGVDPMAKTYQMEKTEIDIFIWALNKAFQPKRSRASRLSKASFNHYEYFPYVPARLHDTSLSITNLSNNDGAATNIPNKQLKAQYHSLLKYTLMTSSTVNYTQPAPASPGSEEKRSAIHPSVIESLPYTQILSLLYYNVLLHQAPSHDILALLKGLFKRLTQAPQQFTSHVQLAYVLCYLDILWGGCLDAELNVDEYKVLQVVYPRAVGPSGVFKAKMAEFGTVLDSQGFPKIKSTEDSPIFFFSTTFSYHFRSYSIPQWSALFNQTVQYLIDGQVELISKLSGTKIQNSLSDPQSSSDEPAQQQTEVAFDENQTHTAEMQRMVRQDKSASSTPVLSCSVRHTPTETQVELVYNNNIVDEAFELSLFYIDSELLLSQKPFIQSQSGTQSLPSAANSNVASGASASSSITLTKPHIKLTIPVIKANRQFPGFINRQTLTLPATMTTNAHVNITAAKSHVSCSAPLLHAGFIVQTLDKLGMVCVLDSKTNKPVSGAYIKTFTRVGPEATGTVDFLCDRYSDIRGRSSFIDASNGNKGNDSDKPFYAVIVSHHKLGTTVVYSRGPQK